MGNATRGRGGNVNKWVTDNAMQSGGKQHDKRIGAKDTLQGDQAADDTTRGRSG